MRDMTVRFLDPLHVWQEDDTWVRSLIDFRVGVTDGADPEEIFTVPMAFRSDYASVPKVPFLYEKFGGVGKLAAFFHDYLYSKDYTGGHDRKWCDAAFHHALLATGVDAATAQAMYEGVWDGGEPHWKT